MKPDYTAMRHNTTQHNITQRNTTQHNTTQYIRRLERWEYVIIGITWGGINLLASLLAGLCGHVVCVCVWTWNVTERTCNVEWTCNIEWNWLYTSHHMTSHHIASHHITSHHYRWWHQQWGQWGSSGGQDWTNQIQHHGASQNQTSLAGNTTVAAQASHCKCLDMCVHV